MGITEELYRIGAGLARDVSVTDVRIGLGYTAVEVDNAAVGLAYTFRSEAGHSCTAMASAGELTGKPAEHLLKLMMERDAVSSAVGFATLNALIQGRIPNDADGNFLNLIKLREGETVGMVGFFGPIIPLIGKAGCELLIFEKNLERGEGLYPPSEIPERLPRCAIVILSATTLVNHTFETIIPYTTSAREVVMLGPTTPMVPEVMGRYRITRLAGMKIVDPRRVLRIVSEAGGTQRLKDAVRKVVVSCEKSE